MLPLNLLLKVFLDEVATSNTNYLRLLDFFSSIFVKSKTNKYTWSRNAK